MKKRFIFGALVAILAFAMIGCPTDDGGNGGGPTLYTVSFDGNGNTGGTAPAAIKQASEGASITLPGAGSLVKTGNTFGGWSTTSTGNALSGTSYTPTSDIKLFAKWTLSNVPSVVSITVTGPAAAAPGTSTAQFHAAVTVTNGAAETVAWSIVEAGKASGTSISSTGLLTVDADEILTQLTIRATSTVVGFTDIYGEEHVTIDADAASVTSITISPKTTADGTKGGTVQFAAAVVGTGTDYDEVTWEVSPTSGGSSIDTEGLLTIGANETAALLTVTVTSVADTSQLDTATVAIPANVITGIAISPTTAEVAKGTTEPFTVQITPLAASQEVTWDVTGGISATTISTTGHLTVAVAETATSLTVTVTSVADPSFSASASVTVTGSGVFVPVDPTGFVETIALENSAYAVYKFELDPDTEWSNFVAISFDVKLVYPENAGPEGTIGRTQIRDVRLLGRYLDTDFITQNPEGNAALDAHVARLMGGTGVTHQTPGNKLAGYIAGQKAAWSNDYAALGWNSANPDDFFTIEYDLSGSDGTGSVGTNQPTHADNAGHWPDPTDKGPFYFGIGINGTDTNLIVQQIKNIKLIADPDLGIDDVYSIGSGFDDPAYAAYVVSGSIKGSDVGNAWRDMGDPVANPAPIYVWFDNNGAPGQTVRWTFPNETIVYPSNPSRDAYLFKGWYDAATGGTEVTATSFAQKTVIYAQWDVDENWKDVADWDELDNVLDISKAVDIWTWINPSNATNQRGFVTKDFDEDFPSDLELVDLQNAIYLVLAVDAFPEGGGQAYLHPKNGTQSWTGGLNVFGNDGPIEDNGVQYYTDEDTGDKAIIIQLSKAFNNYAELAAETESARFFFQYYGAAGKDIANLEDVGLQAAFLLFADNYVIRTGSSTIELDINAPWGSGNQGGWKSADGGEGSVAGLTLEDLLTAQALVLEYTGNLNGLEVQWANETTGQHKATLSPDLNWDNTIDAAEQVKIDAAGITFANGVLTIPFTMLDEEFFDSEEWAGILVQVNNFRTEVTRAYLVK